MCWQGKPKGVIQNHTYAWIALVKLLALAFVADTDFSDEGSHDPGSANGYNARKERRFRSPNKKCAYRPNDGRRIVV